MCDEIDKNIRGNAKEAALVFAANLDRIALADRATRKHSGEHAFPGHDAIAHAMVDRAVAVALFSDLRDLHAHVVAGKLGADGECLYVDALYDEVLAELAVDHFGAAGLEILDALERQQAYLAMPFARMGIADDPEIGFDGSRTHVGLLHALRLAYAYSLHSSHS